MIASFSSFDHAKSLKKLEACSESGDADFR